MRSTLAIPIPSNVMMRVALERGRWVGALFLVALAGLLLLCAQHPRGQERSALTATEWAEDLEFLATTIKTRHLNPFAHQSAPMFDENVAALARALPRMRDETARMVGLARLAASIGDGHTSLEIYGTQPLVPIRFFWFGSELRVIESDAAHRELLGQRVVRIGSTGLDQAAARLRQLIPAGETENYVLGRLQRLLRMPAILRALDLTTSDRDLPIVVQSDRGVRTRVTLPALSPNVADAAAVERPSSAIPLAQSRPGDGFWFARLPGTATVYFNFSGYPPIPEMLGTAEGLSATLAAGDVRVLLVDMRENLGGNFVAGRRVIDLVREPIDGHGIAVVVAIGRDTISAGMTNATDFKKAFGATYIGEISGSRPNGYQESLPFELPHSRIRGSVAQRYYRFQEEDTPGLIPDVSLPPTWAASAAARDEVLEWTIRK
jgi:hypothetical protein